MNFRCSKLTKSQFFSLSQSNEPYFCYSCLIQVISFSLVNKKELNDLNFCNNNINKLKCPCTVFNNICKLSKNCIQCNLCNGWTHFKCSALTTNQFENHVLNENETFFCNLCYNAMFPFNKINNTELMLLNYNLAFENNISDTYSEPHSVYAQYISADRLVTKEVNNDLSFFTYKHKKFTQKHLSTRRINIVL